MNEPTVKARHIADDPTFPWLEAGAVQAVEAFLRERGWLADGDHVRECDKAGEGNMNLTLRVVTDRESVILKQARPWVEKYPQIAAPWDRVDSERRFYERAMYIEPVAARMPDLLGSDAQAKALLLEDLNPAKDLTTLYGEDTLSESELDDLAIYARTLHDAPAPNSAAAGTDAANGQAHAHGRIVNAAMRQLNHEHIFVVPMQPDNALDLDQFEPGLNDAATTLQEDKDYRLKLADTGSGYMAEGPCLLQGDYFPGSWMRTDRGVRVIDPEFCYHGDREFDLGCAVAHFALAGQQRGVAQTFLERYRTADASTEGTGFDRSWLSRYAAAEVMRRLIGVAQLPLSLPEAERAALLERSRQTMFQEDWTKLWK